MGLLLLLLPLFGVFLFFFLNVTWCMCEVGCQLSCWISDPGKHTIRWCNHNSLNCGTAVAPLMLPTLPHFRLQPHIISPSFFFSLPPKMHKKKRNLKTHILLSILQFILQSVKCCSKRIIHPLALLLWLCTQRPFINPRQCRKPGLIKFVFRVLELGLLGHHSLEEVRGRARLRNIVDSTNASWRWAISAVVGMRC